MQVTADDANPAPPESGTSGGSFWGWLRRRLWMTAAEREAAFAARIRALDDAIALTPDAVSNYVLRGEAYLDAGEHTLARLDFEHALRLAEEQIEQRAWGVVAQVMQDRARHGLKVAASLEQPPVSSYEKTDNTERS